MTIDQDIEQGIHMGNLIASMPTSACCTGWRIYIGYNDEGKNVLIKHNEGTPANACFTAVYTFLEAKDVFSWEIEAALSGLYPEFLPVARMLN